MSSLEGGEGEKGEGIPGARLRVRRYESGYAECLTLHSKGDRRRKVCQGECGQVSPMPGWPLYWGTREAWQGFEQRRGAGSALGPGGNGPKWGDWRQGGQGGSWSQGQGRRWGLSLLHQLEFLVDQMGYLSCCSQLTFMGQCLCAKDFEFSIPFSPDSKSIVMLQIRPHYTDENTEAQRGNCAPVTQITRS